ncbi:glycine--tRNA ligase subunit beta [Parvularcula sp. ZS-1/3]|uniref:Glycine--tRNA ligase beta subunit n=1 Tax=Parvularcula mediterranea TaxID=2732508 RepID=A0A7Y3RJU6_9PROT|nr:glycine--tRNA ligase subunit beta [Parvularcula mediterranea]NNU15346.1 glycine--tRNA ligase subunit beta [Parvularcula mediterranea]
MAQLLLELFSEEIPARLQARAAADLERLMTTRLKEANLEWEAAETFYGPRRLTLKIDGLPETSPDLREERKGPKVGAPEKAIEGFLRGAGLKDISEAEIQETKKGEVYVAIIEKKGRATTEVLGEALKTTITDFPWPKSQRWGDGDLRWIRPLRRVLMAFDGKAVPFSLENGSQPVEAGLTTETHRVLGQGEGVATDFADYERVLADGKVMLRGEDRRDRILTRARDLCKGQGLELVEDKGLLEEVTGLAEWPLPHMGSFDEKFLALPDEVITAAMRGHQKYFSVRDPKTRRLAPRFICVADIVEDAWMMSGYERVLTARLSDALFLYQNDLKKPLEEHAKKLSGTTFFEGLGTIADKVERVAALARELAPACGADPDKAERAARLAKADLASEMVYEFPELQGLMGRYYAMEQGEDQAIADAIRDHYKPAGQSDDLPTNEIGVAVSLADKLDTLAAFWSIDQKPTGSRDPFALRRAALAVIRMVLGDALTRDQRSRPLPVGEVDGSASSTSPSGEVEGASAASGEGGLRLQIFKAAERQIAANVAQQRSREADAAIQQEIEAKQREWSYFITNVGAGSYDATMQAIAEKYRSSFPEGSQPFINGFIRRSAADLLTFFHDRLTVYFRDQGFRHDRVAAALTEGADDFVLIEKKLKALSEFLDTSEGADLSAAYKRAANILKAEAKKGPLPAPEPDAGLYEQDEERALAAALDKAGPEAKKHIENEDFASAMRELSEVRPVLDAYFDAVTVNADSKNVRENRLAQLLRFKTIVQDVADFERLEG